MKRNIMYSCARETEVFITAKGNIIYPKKIQLNRYYLEIRPFLILLRLLGRFPHQLPLNGPKKFQLFSFSTLYSLCFYTLQTYWTLLTLKTVYTINKGVAYYDSTLFSILFTVFFLNHFSIPWTYWWQSLRVISYVESWQRCQEELKCINSHPPKRSLARFLLTGVLPGALVIVCISPYASRNLPLESILPVVTSVMGGELSLYLWCISLNYIRFLAKEMRQRVVQTECRDLRKVRRMWLRLRHQLTGLGNNTAHLVLFSATMVFATFLLSLYGIVAYLFRFSVSASSLWGFIGGCLSSMCVHYIFCHVAYETSQELGRRFTSQFLLLNFSTRSKEYLNELMLLLQTIESKPPVINLLSFITISRRLLVSFVTNAVTYLIVLVQFKVSNLANSTKA